MEIPSYCTLCPRECGANRKMGERGVCGADDTLKAALAYLHQWEEPCICTKSGSGTVFFSGCALSCVYCQNREISAKGEGTVISPDRLCEIFFELAQKGAANINLVTAAHYLPQVIYAIQKAKAAGFSLPFVYNSSGYESVESLQKLEGLIDIYLPDLKYTDSSLAKKYSSAENYFPVAKAAIDEMVRQTGTPRFDENGALLRGVIVRQLLLPDALENSKQALKYLSDRYDESIYISIMSQYTPQPGMLPPLDRAVTEKEYAALLDYAQALHIENAYIQEGSAASESFIPHFNGEGIQKLS